MPVLRVEMPAKLEFLLYQQMFLNIERIIIIIFFKQIILNLGLGPFFRHWWGQSPINFFYVALSWFCFKAPGQH